MKVDRYIIKMGLKSKLYKEGNKKATRVFKNGLEMQQYVGFLVLNRECSIDVKNYSGLQKSYIIASSDKEE